MNDKTLPLLERNLFILQSELVQQAVSYSWASLLDRLWFWCEINIFLSELKASDDRRSAMITELGYRWITDG